MDVSSILAEIDAKIASLQQARTAILSLETGSITQKAKRGRPKGSTKAVTVAKVAKKRNLTPEGRKRIKEAMQRRWAKAHATSAKKEAPKKEAVKK